jgi:hypothetical protein
MIALLFILSALSAPAQSVSFNQHVRPILSDKCYACHGPDSANAQSKLRLDQPGHDRGADILKRVTSKSPVLRMPPQYAGKDPLSPAEIDTLRRWIDAGAPYESHWSFSPPARPPLPDVRDSKWVRNPIDRFILARLEQEGLAPSPEAAPAKLRRRAALDLTGLPPAPQPSPYEAFIETRLASPRHAERMAIDWLEAARYADTNGYQSDGVRDMWRWRDWVIQAFAANMPFDRFTVEQIAGDLLPNPTMEQRLATGFHRNHRTSAEGGIVDEEFRVEYVADRTETTANVWLGLTVGCARCHDHKYDPIPQKDFYRLFAFFNSVPERGFVWNFGNEPPLMKAPLPDQARRLAELDARLSQAQSRWNALQTLIEQRRPQWAEHQANLDWTPTEGLTAHLPLQTHPDFRSVPGPNGPALQFDPNRYLNTSGDGARFNNQDPFTFAAWIKPEAENGAILSHSEDYFEGSGHTLYILNGKLRLHAIFRWSDLGMRIESAEPLQQDQWQHVAATYDGSMRAAGVRMYVNGRPVKTNILFDYMIWPITLKAPLRIGAGGGLRFNGAIGDARVYNRALSPLEAASLAGNRDATLRLAFLDLGAPPEVQKSRVELRAATTARDQFLATIPTSMVMAELPEPRETRVLLRGAYDAPGDPVSPAVPSILPPLPPGAKPDRLALARWLVSRENPLTARVQVNRLWAQFFGTGLVKTVNDFGSQGDAPSHPELLDWLAVEFMDSGWDLRHITRLIVTSATYRQDSRVSPALLERDPENRLLARGPRFRLPAAAIRDQALAASGLLVEKTGGPSVNPYQPPGLWEELHGGRGYQQGKGEELYRRSLYTYWKRTIAPPMMVNFDAPTREVCTVTTSRTNTPLQALNLMNDVTFLEAARKLAERMIAAHGLQTGFELVLNRTPNASESDVLTRLLRQMHTFYTQNPSDARAYLQQGDTPLPPRVPLSQLAAWTAVASAILNLDEAVTRE